MFLYSLTCLLYTSMDEYIKMERRDSYEDGHEDGLAMGLAEGKRLEQLHLSLIHISTDIIPPSSAPSRIAFAPFMLFNPLLIITFNAPIGGSTT